MPALLDCQSSLRTRPRCEHFACAFRTPCTGSRSFGWTLLRAHRAPSRLSSPLLPCRRAPPARCRRLPRPVQTQALFGGLFKGDLAAKTRKRYQSQVDQINVLAPEMKQLSDDDLRARTKQLQQRCKDGASLDSLLVETFAVRQSSSKQAITAGVCCCSLSREPVRSYIPRRRAPHVLNCFDL